MTVSRERIEEGMLEGFVSRQPFPGLVDEQLLNQVKELLVFIVHSQHVALQDRNKNKSKQSKLTG